MGYKKIMDEERISKIINDLYLFYRVFVASHFTDNLQAPHIKKLSKELEKLYFGSEEGFQRLCVAMPPSSFQEFFNNINLPDVAYIPQSELRYSYYHEFW